MPPGRRPRAGRRLRRPAGSERRGACPAPVLHPDREHLGARGGRHRHRTTASCPAMRARGSSFSSSRTRIPTTSSASSAVTSTEHGFGDIAVDVAGRIWPAPGVLGTPLADARSGGRCGRLRRAGGLPAATRGRAGPRDAGRTRSDHGVTRRHHAPDEQPPRPERARVGHRLPRPRPLQPAAYSRSCLRRAAETARADAQPARRLAALGHALQGRVLCGATVEHQRTTRMEAAPGRRAGRVGHLPGQRLRHEAAAVGVRDRTDQSLGVRVQAASTRRRPSAPPRRSRRGTSRRRGRRPDGRCRGRARSAATRARVRERG